MKILHPLAEFEDQIVQDSQALSELRTVEGIGEKVSSLPRRMVRRMFAAQVSQRVKDWCGGRGIHQRVLKVPQE
jgi:hypothetical protein